MLNEELKTMRILGVPVSKVDLKTAVNSIVHQASNRLSGYVCVRDVHGLMRARADSKLLSIHEEAFMVTPDGMPIAWTLKLYGAEDTGRVCGADLVEGICADPNAAGLKHFFYGGKDGVANLMAQSLQVKFPWIQLAGTYSPPFRQIGAVEKAKIANIINESRADIIWVGLSTPKQEYWMSDNVRDLNGAVLIGVGAAFDFFSGEVARAPRWMRNSGFEWFHRLISEPKRLWKRYLIMAPHFVLMLSYEFGSTRFRRLLGRPAENSEENIDGTK